MAEKQSGDFLRASEWNGLARDVDLALEAHGGRGRIGGSFGTQARSIPGGAGLAIQVWRVFGYTTGLFSVANSGLSCKRPQDFTNAAIPATPVVVWSYDPRTGHEAEIGRVDLVTSSPFRVGSYVRLYAGEYVDGLVRLCLLDAVELVC